MRADVPSPACHAVARFRSIRFRTPWAGLSLPALIATVAVMSFPGTGMSQVDPRVREAQQEWIAIQLESSREDRAAWWRSLDANRLDGYLAAGVDLGVADRRGWTTLHSAARYSGSTEVVTGLLEAGVDVDARDRAGGTPLHWAAAENPNAGIIDALVLAGADVNARDKFGWLPLHSATEGNSNPDVIEGLLAAGAARDKRAYFILFSSRFLLKHNSNMSDVDKAAAMALLEAPGDAGD